MARIVCATAPVIGAERTRPPTDSTRCARAADTGVLRTLVVIVAPARASALRYVTDAERELVGREHLRVGLGRTARTGEPAVGAGRHRGDEVDAHRLLRAVVQDQREPAVDGSRLCHHRDTGGGLERRRHVALRRARRRGVDRAAGGPTTSVTASSAAAAPTAGGAARGVRDHAERAGALTVPPRGWKPVHPGVKRPLHSELSMPRTKTDTKLVAETTTGDDVVFPARSGSRTSSR